MEKYNEAFRAYDIRGIFWKDIDAYFCFIMGYATGEYLIKKHGENASILISGDTRKINTALIDQYIIWLTQAGISHIDTVQASASPDYPYGITSSSAAYHVGQQDRDMTAIFTASHNPAEYTGIKCFDRTAALTPTDLLKDIFTQAYTLRENKTIPTVAKPYRSNNDLVNQKIQSYYQTIQSKRSQLQKNHKFVVDFCHGAAVSFEKTFYETYANNHLITMLNDYPDGTFPAHEGETLDPDNYKQIVEEIQKQGAEFWVMFDGDADRIGFVSNTGKVIAGDIIYAIITKQILQDTARKNPILLHDCMSSKITSETITQYGGTPQISRMWRFFISQKMVEIEALAGGEVSGHYMFGELGCVESVLITQYYVMKELENYNDMDTMISRYQKYYKWLVQSVVVEDKNQTIQKVKNGFATERQEHLDGISVYADTYWFNLRASNTENKIRFSVEADNETIRKEVVQKLQNIINQ
jgi:phosphomannomutase